MKMNIFKLINSLDYGERIPRKVKKWYLGKKVNKSKLRKLLKSVVVVPAENDSRDGPEILPYTFCPRCGCKESTNSGNMAMYPEYYIHYNCQRCGFLVGLVDNSRFVHALECAEYDYNI
jgi:hypothetical protein